MMQHGVRKVRESVWIGAGVALATALILMAGPSVARAGTTEAELSVNGGTGAPGGTVAVTVALANNPDNTATSADVDFTFPTDQVEFFPPVSENCSIAERLAETHEVGGTLAGAGLLRLSVFVKGTPVEFPPLGDGDLASCNFHILPGIPAGTAALEIDTALLFAGLDSLPVTPVNGAIVITNQTPTFTPTNTPIPPTATLTPTGVPTGSASATVTSTATATPTTPGTQMATATPTPTTPGATATPTRTSGTPTATGTPIPAPADSDDCHIGPIDRSYSGGSMVLLLVPALLVWARRRRF